MLKELLKRLQKRELTEQQEQELLNQLQDAANLIVENTKQRAIEEAKRKEINKDPQKVDRLNEIDTDLAKLNKKVASCETKYHLLAIMVTLSIIVSSCGLFVLGSNVLNSLLWAILLPILSVGAFIGVSFPFVKLITNKYYKHWDKINELNREKQAIIDEIYVDLEKLGIENIKLTNLPKLRKNNEKIKEDIITEQNTNTI